MAGLIFSVPPELEARIQAEAERRAIGSAKLIEAILDQHLPTAGETNALETVFQLAQEAFKDVPADEWKNLPADLSTDLDHYLYGVPRR